MSPTLCLATRHSAAITPITCCQVHEEVYWSIQAGRESRPVARGYLLSILSPKVIIRQVG